MNKIPEHSHVPLSVTWSSKLFHMELGRFERLPDGLRQCRYVCTCFATASIFIPMYLFTSMCIYCLATHSQQKGILSPKKNSPSAGAVEQPPQHPLVTGCTACKRRAHNLLRTLMALVTVSVFLTIMCRVATYASQESASASERRLHNLFMFAATLVTTPTTFSASPR